MTQLLRPVGYTGTLQTLTIPENFGSSFTAYLWGAGGGGGGGDYVSPTGGNGSGGGYSQVTVPVNAGDVISIAVGGAGGGGLGQRRSAAGGAAGASYVADQVFNLASVSGTRVSNGAWCGFLNTYGVWGTSGSTWDVTFSVSFPLSGYYTFTSSCDNYATIYVDGVEVLVAPGYTSSYDQLVFVTAGTRSIRIVAVNYGGPAGVALLIASGISYSGGSGGNAGGSGSSGAGGGSGGATVLFLNGNLVAVAGGGGGGGGAGRSSGGNSPGPTGQSSSSSAGQNGENKPGDGGGGGAGGGGYRGGNGGYTISGDQGAYAGTNGTSSGDVVANPTNINPANSNSPYYTGNPGRGGRGSNGNGSAGTSGYAVFDFDVSGLYIKESGSFTPVNTTYVKNNNVWTPVQTIWIKDGGTWKQVQGGSPPVFTSVSGNFGINPRPYS